MDDCRHWCCVHIDNDTREKKNKIVSFHLFLLKIATIYTWDDRWKNGFNDKRRYGCVSVNQFSSLTGKKNTGLRRWPLILASLHAESIFHFLSRKRRKYPNTDTTGQVSVFCFFAFYCNSMHWTIGKFWIQPPRLYLLSHPQPKNNILKENYIR